MEILSICTIRKWKGGGRIRTAIETRIPDYLEDLWLLDFTEIEPRLAVEKTPAIAEHFMGVVANYLVVRIC